ncbi:hypothetical protein [Corynebacterium sp. LK2510]|uniref:hypothetical protein n=1 Tax=Corynebacterium sp. LK2510 TaxID=3110472 RepID=UPI0034CFFF75
MRRIATAAVAATTALSLVAAPAMAQTETKEPTSSVKIATELSSKYSSEADQAKLSAAALSSFMNDAEKGYAMGTTLDIILATIALAVIGGGIAVQQGLVQLPF